MEWFGPVATVLTWLFKGMRGVARLIRKGEASQVNVSLWSWHVTVLEGERGRRLDAFVQVHLENRRRERRERVKGASLLIRQRLWRFRRTVLEVPLRSYDGPHLPDLAIDPLAPRIGLGLGPFPAQVRGMPALPRNCDAVLVLYMAEPVRRIDTPLGMVNFEAQTPPPAPEALETPQEDSPQ
jgi:hypothetical protein